MAWQGKTPTQFALEILENAEQRTKNICIDMLSGVIYASPVMDGAFRGNHRLTINSVDYSADLKKQDLVGNTTLSNGMKELLNFKLGDVVSIQNNLPYAIRLENGYSGQAPQGIYAITFRSVVSKYP